MPSKRALLLLAAIFDSAMRRAVNTLVQQRLVSWWSRVLEELLRFNSGSFCIPLTLTVMVVASRRRERIFKNREGHVSYRFCDTAMS
jgi:hypothetical protein